ncbi:hypothetical protein PHMEG_00035691 [Phytophthora megakarya]|uniref:Chromo domain-containing protein n=1 Tax=Phytophthora megakarya TaxID=4795 RepID=A0A225UN41_9STRA|nr:hypothetical protein PHMEG_00035691 [Phytophthora megakarya]
MPSKPSKNAISSAKEFKTLFIVASKEHKIRVSDEAIRHLRLSMNTVVVSTSLLPEAINVICAAMADRKKRRVNLADVREWLAAPPPAEDEESDDCDLDGEKQHLVRKLWNWKRVKGKTYYLVNWEPTWEPRAHINPAVVAAFEEERRLLVRKKFFEDEAVEDNSLNDTEG